MKSETEQAELFPVKTNPIKKLVRSGDPSTSRLAATAILPHINNLQSAVLQAFRDHGDMIDEELMDLARFTEYQESTIRTRRSELVEKGFLIKKGEARNSRGQFMSLWGLIPSEHQRNPPTYES